MQRVVHRDTRSAAGVSSCVAWKEGGVCGKGVVEVVG